MKEDLVQGHARLHWLITAQEELDQLEKHGYSHRLVASLFFGGAALIFMGGRRGSGLLTLLGGASTLVAAGLLLRDILRSRKRKALGRAIDDFDDGVVEIGPPLNQDWGSVQGVVWDWGDTLMRDVPGQVGPMVDWDHVEAMPGARSAVRALSGLAVRCVATNAIESTGTQVAAALDRVGLRPSLSQFFTSGELGASKPDPEFFAEVARRLGVAPTAILAVGNDYKKDIVPAKAVGMRTVLVSCEEDPGSQDAADFRIPSLSQLPGMAREWGLGKG